MLVWLIRVFEKAPAWGAGTRYLVLALSGGECQGGEAGRSDSATKVPARLKEVQEQGVAEVGRA
jgi:hypothetical protein